MQRLSTLSSPLMLSQRQRTSSPQTSLSTECALSSAHGESSSKTPRLLPRPLPRPTVKARTTAKTIAVILSAALSPSSKPWPQMHVLPPPPPPPQSRLSLSLSTLLVQDPTTQTRGLPSGSPWSRPSTSAALSSRTEALLLPWFPAVAHHKDHGLRRSSLYSINAPGWLHHFIRSIDQAGRVFPVLEVLACQSFSGAERAVGGGRVGPSLRDKSIGRGMPT